MITRPQRASIQEPSNAKTTKDWSEAEEEDDAAFARSSIIARTPSQTCCTPTDVTMAPKKKEPTLTMKLRGTNATSTAQPSTQSDEASDEAITEPSLEDLIQEESP